MGVWHGAKRQRQKRAVADGSCGGGDEEVWGRDRWTQSDKEGQRRPRKASEILSARMLGEDQLERVARTARRCRGALGGALGRVSTRVLPHE